MEEFQFNFESSAQIYESQRSLFSFQVGMVGMIDSLTDKSRCPVWAPRSNRSSIPRTRKSHWV